MISYSQAVNDNYCPQNSVANILPIGGELQKYLTLLPVQNWFTTSNFQLYTVKNQGCHYDFPGFLGTSLFLSSLFLMIILHT